MAHARESRLTTPGRPYGRPTLFHLLRIVAIALFTLVTGTAGYALADSNGGLSGSGGDGAGAISGYSVSNVSYTLNFLDPTRIDAVSFDIDADSTLPSVKVKLVRDSEFWHACSVAVGQSPSRVNCQLQAPVAVAAVDEVHVVAAQ